MKPAKLAQTGVDFEDDAEAEIVYDDEVEIEAEAATEDTETAEETEAEVEEPTEA